MAQYGRYNYFSIKESVVSTGENILLHLWTFEILNRQLCVFMMIESFPLHEIVFFVLD